MKHLLIALFITLSFGAMAQKPDTLKSKVDTNYLNKHIAPLIQRYNQNIKWIDSLQTDCKILIGRIQSFEQLKEEQKKMQGYIPHNLSPLMF